MATKESHVIQMDGAPTSAEKMAALLKAAQAGENLPAQTLTPEEIEALIKSKALFDEKGLLKNPENLEDILKKTKESLVVTIKSLEKNPSMIARAAQFWHQVPLWQKILGGLALSAPPLLLGILINIGSLLAICGLCTIIYTASSILLDDYSSSNASVIENLTKGITALADLLGGIIKSLEVTARKLSAEVDRMTGEVDKLSGQNDRLKGENEKLAHQIEEVTKVVKAINQTKEDLLKTAGIITGTVDLQTTLIHAQGEELAKTTTSYKEGYQILTEKLAELAQINTILERTLAANAAIQTSMNNFMAMSSASAEQQKAFLERLDAYIADPKASFDSLFTGFKSILEGLQKTAKELAQHSKDQKAITEAQTAHLKSLHSLENPNLVALQAKYDQLAQKHTKALLKLSMFGFKDTADEVAAQAAQPVGPA